MSGVSRRFRSLRVKHSKPRDNDRNPSNNRKTGKQHADLLDVFTPEDPKQKFDGEQEKKIQTVLKNVRQAGITILREPQVQYALQANTVDWDAEKAIQLLFIVEDSIEGILRDQKPGVKLLGAENRKAVTCYLDSLLFAMFAKLDSFEAILFDHFENGPQRRLAGLLRFWVNMLRSGMLITTDITKHIQEALAAAGWEDARLLRQQDASEAFTFITDVLKLPLLTLKMDIFHPGREEASDDHKFINERLLEVAIPEPPEDGSPVTLETCLETYFNNRIEVKRHLQRRATLQSPGGRQNSVEKSGVIHIESVELSGPETPVSVSTPELPSPRPLASRTRQDSIFSERRVSPLDTSTSTLVDKTIVGRPVAKRQNSGIKKEVLMPAWQFFSLIPWYTDNAPKNDLQVAAHFSTQRPILGICLKRYSMQPDGRPIKLDTHIDIPLEIGLPHFISDDQMDEEGPIYGSFKLSLQSVVCHRGTSVDSGHYISIIRSGDSTVPQIHTDDEKADGELGTTWLMFDDLAPVRVKPVDILQTLKDESPYLLFYQVQPVDEPSLSSDTNPPTYEESCSTTAAPSTDNLQIPGIDNLRPRPASASQQRPVSLDLSALASALPRGRNSTSSNRSITFEESSIHPSRHATAPTTPTEDVNKTGVVESPRRSSTEKRSKSRSRTHSRNNSRENRLSLTFSKMTGRISKDPLVPPAPDGNSESTSEPSEHPSEKKDSATSGLNRSKSKSKKVKKPRTDGLERECIIM